MEQKAPELGVRFVAALKQWEHLHQQLDLTEAYKRARNTFTGKLEHLFVVIKEVDTQNNASDVNKVPVGTKRLPAEALLNAAKK